MQKKFKNKVFLSLSLAILLIDFFYVFLNIHLEHKSLDASLEEDGRILKSSYQLIMSQQQDTMLAIATFIANDPEVAKLFSEAKQAVAAEGGGAGGVESDRIRKLLYQKVAPAWQTVQANFTARQLHFHLGPGDTSFLRVHKPDKFGDDLSDIRHIIVDTNREHTARSGFETGRIYAGIRGVVPVFYPTGLNEQRQYIGALEVGTSFKSILDELDKQYNLGAAVFLNKSHVEETMWQKSVNQQYPAETAQCNCYLEASTRDNVPQIMSYAAKVVAKLSAGVHRIQIENEHIELVFVPIKDYLAEKNPASKAVGSVVFWRNVDEQIEALNQSVTYNILYGVIGFIVLEILIFIAVRIATRSLENQIHLQAKNLLKTNWELNLADNVIKNLHEGIVITDEQQNIIRINPAVSHITGYSTDELIGNKPRIFSADKQTQAFYQNLSAKLAESGFWQGEVWEKKKGGELYAQSIAVTAVKDGDNNLRNFVSVFSDVTQQKEHSQELEKAAFYDALTGLPNRMLLAIRLQAAINALKHNHSIMACVYLDLDEFKPVNDTYGHEAGDFLLIELAKRMSQVLRKQDTLSRLGGDEFVAVITELTDKAQCFALIDRLLKEIERVVDYQGAQLKVSASIGVAFVSDTELNLSNDEVLRRADQAMYQAKTSGKNKYAVFEKI